VKLLPLKDVIRLLDLKPLVGEGGLWKQTYLSDETLPASVLPGRTTDRLTGSAIHFLLTPETFSCMHRLESDEIWYFHMGASVEMLLLYPDGTAAIEVLGHDLLSGQRLQLTVPKGTWMGAQLHEKGEYGLLSTSMAPGYADCEFEAASFDALLPLLTDPAQESMLRRLTGEPRYE